MQFSFLGFSTVKIMEFNLDVKDIIILKYFNDFKNSGKMNFEVVNGEKYYWLSYKNIIKLYFNYLLKQRKEINYDRKNFKYVI